MRRDGCHIPAHRGTGEPAGHARLGEGVQRAVGQRQQCCTARSGGKPQSPSTATA
ncbi:MAG: hypothetical protein M9891_06005 [Austwickia sp.]|nr:hypothetical protein [Austwickia sp.]